MWFPCLWFFLLQIINWDLLYCFCLRFIIKVTVYAVVIFIAFCCPHRRWKCFWTEISCIGVAGKLRSWPQELFVVKPPQRCDTQWKGLRWWVHRLLGSQSNIWKTTVTSSYTFPFYQSQLIKAAWASRKREFMRRFLKESFLDPLLYQTIHIAGISGEFSNWWEFIWMCGER